MKSIRVLVANSPRLMRELVVETISDQPDIEVVGEIKEESGIETAVDQTQPDFLIVALDSGDRLPDSCQAVLQSHPKVRIIGIAADRNSTVFYWASLRVQSNEIEASEAGVLNALRGISQPSPRLQ
jgi:DNA-binding NarL/FixJ family response regulator